MPSYPRYAIIWDNAMFQLSWQCHNRAWLLESDWAKQLYYDLLLTYKDQYRVAIHSYDFMCSYPSLTGRIEGTVAEFSAFLQIVHSQWARAINRFYGRCGQVIMDRFRSPVIQDDAAHLQVLLYSNLDPVLTGIVRHPEQYRWTSYHYYATGRADALITPAPAYMSLASSERQRQRRYRRLVWRLLRNLQRIPRPYPHLAYYLGDPAWVTERMRALRHYRYGQGRLARAQELLRSVLHSP